MCKDDIFCDKWVVKSSKLSGVRRRLQYPFYHKYFLLSRFLLPLLKRNAHALILDFGCGSGSSSVNLSKDFGYEVIGVDISAHAIGIAKEQAKEDKYASYFVVADARRLPFKDSQFDGVYSCDVLGHISNVSLAVAEIGRVLKNCGVAAIFSETQRSKLVFFENYLITIIGHDIINEEDKHVNLCSRKTLVTMFDSVGLSVEKCYSPYLIRFILYPKWYYPYITRFNSLIDRRLWVLNLALLKIEEKTNNVWKVLRTLYFYLELYTIGRIVETAGLFLKLSK